MKIKIYSHLHRVTYGDCTQGNHVYYGRYPYLLEEARGEFFRYLGTTFHDYHKKQRTDRKLGHLTCTAEDRESLEKKLQKFRDII